MKQAYILLLLTVLLTMKALVLRAQAEADTVRIETNGNYIAIPVMLDGKPKRFILDTGCAANVVFSHAIDTQHKVTAEGGSIESSTGKTERAAKTMCNLKVCRFDSDEETPVYVTAVDSIMMLRGDGIVGMQYILEHKQLNMKLDVPNKQVVFTRDKHLFDDEDGWKVRTRLVDNRMVLKMKMSPGIKVRNVVLDSGCDHLFSLDAACLDRVMSRRQRKKFAHQVQGEKESRMEGMYGLGSGMTTALRLDRLTVARLHFHGVEAETGKESLLGFPFLQAASIVVYSNGKHIKVMPHTAVRDYMIVRKKEEVKQGGYIITYDNEEVTPIP